MMPFGRIKNDALVKAMDILKKLGPLVKSVTKRKEGPLKDTDEYFNEAEEVKFIKSS